MESVRPAKVSRTQRPTFLKTEALPRPVPARLWNSTRSGRNSNTALFFRNRRRRQALYAQIYGIWPRFLPDPAMKTEDRVLLKSLRRYADRRRLKLDISSLAWIATLSDDTRNHHIFGYDLGLNTSSAARVALTRRPPPRFWACRGPARAASPLRASRFVSLREVDSNWPELLSTFEEFGHSVVVKDNEGTGGKCVWRADTLGAFEAVVTQTFESCRDAVGQSVPHDYE